MSNIEYIDLSKDDTINQLKQENQLLRKTLNNLKGDKASDTLVNAVNAYYEPLLQDKFDEIERLKKELTEKDREIEKLKLELEENENIIDFHMKNNIYNVALKDYSVLAPYPKNMAQIIRHEICEEIRNKAGEYWTRLEDDNEQLVDYYITTKDLDEIIDKIEGEK